MSALLEDKDELVHRYAEKAQELAALKRERDDEPPKYASGKAATTGASEIGTRPPAADITLPVAPGEVAQTIAGDEPDEISWPVSTPPSTSSVNRTNYVQANMFPLYIGSACSDYRRDMTEWRPMNRDGWTDRLNFNVFKFEEPSTIKIFVVESTSGSHRVMVNREPWALEGWKKRCEFNAYGRARPGTQAMWIGYKDDPDRCVFVKGGRGEAMEGWERRLEFWVPM